MGTFKLSSQHFVAKLKIEIILLMNGTERNKLQFVIERHSFLMFQHIKQSSIPTSIRVILQWCQRKEWERKGAVSAWESSG